MYFKYITGGKKSTISSLLYLIDRASITSLTKTPGKTCRY